MKRIEIPNSVRCLGLISKLGGTIGYDLLYGKDGTFEGCSSLQSIKIPNSINSIASHTFEGCSELQKIDIPNSVSRINRYAFFGCSALQSIYMHIINIENANIAKSAFDGIDTDNCVLYIPPGTRWEYRHHPVFGKFKNIEIEKQE